MEGRLVGGAALFFVMAYFAGPIMAIADVLGVAYVVFNGGSLRGAFWYMFGLCAVSGVILLWLSPEAWWALIRGRFVDPGSPMGEDYAITRIVPWTAGFLLLIPVIQLVVRRRF